MSLCPLSLLLLALLSNNSQLSINVLGQNISKSNKINQTQNSNDTALNANDSEHGSPFTSNTSALNFQSLLLGQATVDSSNNTHTSLDLLTNNTVATPDDESLFSSTFPRPSTNSKSTSAFKATLIVVVCIVSVLFCCLMTSMFVLMIRYCRQLKMQQYSTQAQATAQQNTSQPKEHRLTQLLSELQLQHTQHQLQQQHEQASATPQLIFPSKQALTSPQQNNHAPSHYTLQLQHSFGNRQLSSNASSSAYSHQAQCGVLQQQSPKDYVQSPMRNHTLYNAGQSHSVAVD